MQTEICKINPLNPEPELIDKAAELLRMGEIVAFPTDTVYGIAADAANEKAVGDIFAVKCRDTDKPLQVLIPGQGDLHLLTDERTQIMKILASEFWPGPLTLIVSAREGISDRIRCGRATVGVRVPANPIALKLIEAFGAPVAATSANISGAPDPVNADEVIDYLGGRIRLLLDGGATPGGIPSTVLDISVRPPAILRHGKLSDAKLNRIIETV